MQERYGRNAASSRLNHSIFPRKTYELGEFMGARKIVHLFGRKVRPEADSGFFREVDMPNPYAVGEVGWERVNRNCWK